MSSDLNRCAYYETCATYGLNVERVFQDGKISFITAYLAAIYITQIVCLSLFPCVILIPGAKTESGKRFIPTPIIVKNDKNIFLVASSMYYSRVITKKINYIETFAVNYSKHKCLIHLSQKGLSKDFSFSIKID